MKPKQLFLMALVALCSASCCRQKPVDRASNPIIFADVPDLSMMRVGDTYYMSSTTMHMAPGVPIMKSTDLVNWELVSYCYDTLDPCDEMSLNNGKSTYSLGTWASSIRYHKGTYYVSTFSHTTRKNYLYYTQDIENGPWQCHEFGPMCHDHTLFFDDDDRIYMIWGVGRLMIQELKPDLTGAIEGSQRVLIENNSAVVPGPMSLRGEGSQLFKVDGRYYLFNICWPRGGMRTVTVHRADHIDGPWEGRMALQDKGVAQGGLIDTPEGDWYAYLFRDYGAVGRIPYWVPVTWEDGWPVLGVEGKVPDTLNLPASRGLMPGIVNSDEFVRTAQEPALPLVWQWNHNPDNDLWSISEREGYLRLRTARIDHDFLLAKNTLTQRTFGPTCTANTCLEVAEMNDGDFAGLCLLQRDYGLVGVKKQGGKHYLYMTNTRKAVPTEMEQVELTQDKVYLRADCDFTEMKDEAVFFYSLDGNNWQAIGDTLQMVYSMPHFMGYRYGLYYYSSQQPGGCADFDYFRIAALE